MKPPSLKTHRLLNGLRLVYRQTPDNPVSAAHLFFSQGAASETAAEKGVTTLMWSLLLKGTEKRGAQKIAEDLEAIGAHLGGGANHDNSQASCHAVADYFPLALEIFAETLLKPAHLPAEIEKEKTAQIAAIAAKKESIFSVANDLLNSHLYKNHPYASPTSGQKSTVSSLSATAIARRHRQIVVPDGAVLSLAAPHPFATVLPLLKRLFGPAAWPSTKKKAPSIVKARLKISTYEVQEKHPFEQAFLMVGFPTVPVSAKDYVPLKILGVALGGGMSSRLFQSLREERALAYDVGAFLSGRKSGSAFIIYMGLQLAKLEEAKREIFRELERIQKKKLSTDELQGVKNYFKGSFILDHQTNSQRSYYLGWSLIAGKSLTYDKEFLRQIDRTTPAILQRVARVYLNRPRVTVEIRPK